MHTKTYWTKTREMANGKIERKMFVRLYKHLFGRFLFFFFFFIFQVARRQSGAMLNLYKKPVNEHGSEAYVALPSH